MTAQTLNSIPKFSPLEPVFASHGINIPYVFQEQFLHSPEYSYTVQLEGKIHRVWHKEILHPLFWLLGRGGILIPKSGQNVPCVFRVGVGYFSDGQPYQRWERTLYFDKPIHFNTTVLYDQALGLIGDLVGPKDFIYITWKAAFHPPFKFTLDTAKCAFKIGKRFLWLPEWLWPLIFGVVRFVQKVDEHREDTVHIDLLLTHPWFGEIFGYTGTFRAVRVSIQGDD